MSSPPQLVLVTSFQVAYESKAFTQAIEQATNCSVTPAPPPAVNLTLVNVSIASPTIPVIAMLLTGFNSCFSVLFGDNLLYVGSNLYLQETIATTYMQIYNFEVPIIVLENLVYDEAITELNYQLYQIVGNTTTTTQTVPNIYPIKYVTTLFDNDYMYLTIGTPNQILVLVYDYEFNQRALFNIEIPKNFDYYYIVPGSDIDNTLLYVIGAVYEENKVYVYRYHKNFTNGMLKYVTEFNYGINGYSFVLMVGYENMAISIIPFKGFQNDNNIISVGFVRDTKGNYYILVYTYNIVTTATNSFTIPLPNNYVPFGNIMTINSRYVFVGLQYNTTKWAIMIIDVLNGNNSITNTDLDVATTYTYNNIPITLVPNAFMSNSYFIYISDLYYNGTNLFFQVQIYQLNYELLYKIQLTESIYTRNKVKISGYVLQSTTGKPVSNVTVVLAYLNRVLGHQQGVYTQIAKTTTDDNGFFSFDVTLNHALTDEALSILIY